MTATLFPDDQLSHVTQCYAEALADPGEGESNTKRGLWVSPNQRACQEAARRITAVAPTVWRPNFRTLSQAASAILTHAGSPVRRMTRVQQAELVGGLVTRGMAQGRLDRLESLASSGALTRLALRRINELRHEGVEPKFARARLETNERDGGEALAWLYRGYVDQLSRRGLLDDAGAMLAAAQFLNEKNATSRWKTLVLHATFRPFSVVEATLLKAILGVTDQRLVVGPSVVVNRQTPAANRWLARLSDQLGEPLEPGSLEPPPSPVEPREISPGCRRIRERLFQEETPPPTAAPTAAEDIEVVAAATEQDEVRRIALRVKRWLFEQLVSPREILVAVPTTTYAERLRNELTLAGIPATFDAISPLARSAGYQLMIGLLQTDLSDWAYEDVLAMLRRQDCSAFSTNSARDNGAAERVVRGLQAPNGRTRLLSEAEHADNAQALEPLRALAAAIDDLPTTATPIGWIDALHAVKKWLGWRPVGLSSETTAFEKGADVALERAAADLHLLAKWQKTKPPEWTRAEALQWFTSAAETVSVRLAANLDSTLRVVSYDTAATLATRCLVIAGAGEAAFSITTGVAGEGQTAGDLSLHRFHQLVSRPSDRLLVAYAALDEKGQTRRPSPYVSDLEGLFPEGALRRDRELLRAIDSHGWLPNLRALRLSAVAAAERGETQCFAELLGLPHSAGERQLVGVRVVRERATGDDRGVFEGVMAGSAKRLADRFGPDHAWSASQLERYARCPFQFFAHEVLRAEPPENLQLQIDALSRGSRLHEMLADLHAEVERGVATQEEVRAALDRTFEHVGQLGGLPEHLRPLIAIERLQLERWLESYPQDAAEYQSRWQDLDQPLRPQLFEARFGKKPRKSGVEDDQSVETPLTLEAPGVGPVQISGSIDRVDVGHHAGRTVFGVIDYKSSATLTAKESSVEQGTQLQPLLYALAARQLFLDEGGEDALPLFAGYWALRAKGKERLREPVKELGVRGSETPHTTAAWDETVEKVLSRIAQIVSDVRAGEFGVLPVDDKVCRSCDYRTVCRVGHARAVGKLPDTDDTPTEGASE